MSDIDAESRDFVYNWVQNNVSHPGPWWKSDVHDLSSVENRMLQLEADKDSLQLQVTILEDQLDSQTNRSAELERNLREKGRLLCGIQLPPFRRCASARP